MARTKLSALGAAWGRALAEEMLGGGIAPMGDQMTKKPVAARIPLSVTPTELQIARMRVVHELDGGDVSLSLRWTLKGFRIDIKPFCKGMLLESKTFARAKVEARQVATRLLEEAASTLERQKWRAMAPRSLAVRP